MCSRTKLQAILFAGLLSSLGVVSLISAVEEVELSLDQVPQVVRDTILREAAGAAITEVERQTKEGQTIYEAEFTLDGREVEIQVSPSGELLAREVEEPRANTLTLDKIPEAARSVLLSRARGAPLVELEQEAVHGVTVYEAAWSAGGRKHEAAVTADGALVELEETIPLAEVPAAVGSAIQKLFGAGAPAVVERKMIVVYEVEGKLNGKDTELLMYPTGQVHENDESDDGDKNGEEEQDDNGEDSDHDDDRPDGGGPDEDD